VDTAAIRAGLVAEQAANRKLTKYAELAPDYILQPIAVENLGSFDLSTSSFFYLISAAKFVHHLAKTKKLHSFSSASLFLFDVSILCFCTILSSRTVRTNSLPDLILISVFNPRDLYYRGYKLKKK